MCSGQCSSSLSWTELKETLSQSLGQRVRTLTMKWVILCMFWMRKERKRSIQRPHRVLLAGLHIGTDGTTRPRGPDLRWLRQHRHALALSPGRQRGDAGAAPAVSRFQPRRTPGVQIEKLSPHSPRDPFSYFLLLIQSGQSAATQTKRQKQSGCKYQWTDVEIEDVYKFFGLLIYMSLMSLSSLQDYWRHMMGLSHKETRRGL